jgi:hypothetical protein
MIIRNKSEIKSTVIAEGNKPLLKQPIERGLRCKGTQEGNKLCVSCDRRKSLAAASQNVEGSRVGESNCRPILDSDTSTQESTCVY